MTYDKTTPSVHGSDKDIVSLIAHALRYRSGQATRDADRIIAHAAAERILEALKHGYIVTPKTSTPLATIAQHPKMGGDR